MGTSHPLSLGSNNHAITANPNATGTAYADIAARDADTAFQITTNINKVVRVESPLSFFILTSIGPAVWIPLGVIDPIDTFLELTDTPASYSGQGLKGVRVNVGETALEFSVGQDGDVVGPATATNNALARFDLATGKLIKDSVAILNDFGELSGLTQINIGTLFWLNSTFIDTTSQITIESVTNDVLKMKGIGLGSPVLFEIESGVITAGKFGDLGSSGIGLNENFGQIGWKNFSDLELAPQANVASDIALYTPNAGLTSLVERMRIKTATGDVLIGNLSLVGNTLGTTDANGNLLLAPNGSGLVDATTRRIINVVDPTNPQDAATRQFVLDNAGTGDVVGPGSATDNAMTVWDGVTGKLLKNSPHIIDPTTGKILFDVNEDVVARFVMNAGSGNPSFVDIEDASGIRTRYGYFGTSFLSNAAQFGQIGTDINGGILIASRGNFAGEGIQFYTPNPALTLQVLRVQIKDLTGEMTAQDISLAPEKSLYQEVYPNTDRQVLALSMQDQLDRSSFGNDLLLEGSAIIEEGVGRIGKGLRLDGSILTTGRVLTSSSLEFVDDLSVDFWLFPLDSGALFCPVVAKMDSGIGKGWNVTYFNNSIRITLRDDPTLTDLTLAIGLVLTTTWNYVAVTFDKSTLTLKVYINGILTNTNVVSQGWTDSGDDLMIGSRLSSGNPGNFCNINVSNVHVYNRVLELEEIRIQYLR